MSPSTASRPLTIAIMQPYLFPYLGYFQLMHAAQRFVVYDDVNYMKQGWVNRNYILMNGRPLLFTLPLSHASALVPINTIDVHPSGYGRWRDKFLTSLRQAYAHAPFRGEVLPLVERTLVPGAEHLSEVLLRSLVEIRAYLGIQAELIPSSSGYENSNLGGVERVMDICAREGAGAYVNPIGGKLLYSREQFNAAGIQLYFLRSRPIEYPQGKHSFVPNLSILDVMMWNPRETIHAWMANYALE